jgi:hypothetical protein
MLKNLLKVATEQSASDSSSCDLYMDDSASSIANENLLGGGNPYQHYRGGDHATWLQPWTGLGVGTGTQDGWSQTVVGSSNYPLLSFGLLEDWYVDLPSPQASKLKCMYSHSKLHSELPD